MNRTALLVLVAALAGCASPAAPILRQGQQIVVGTTPSAFDRFDLAKPRQYADVRAEAAPARLPTSPLDRALIGPRRP